ncbi:MAG TPA: response regulator [Gemmatimonadales bacterium]|nr:response regulator [Gemmatimonadales bacterium]
MSPDEAEILLVEDNPADVELTLRSLRQQRIANRVHVARDGEEALAYLFGERGGPRPAGHLLPRLVLLDLKLPKVDGLEVLRAIRADPRTRTQPVVILTSSKEERDLVSSYDLGANSYIQKPVDFDQFQKIVTQLGLYWLVINEPPPRAHGRQG